MAEYFGDLFITSAANPDATAPVPMFDNLGAAPTKEEWTMSLKLLKSFYSLYQIIRHDAEFKQTLPFYVNTLPKGHEWLHLYGSLRYSPRPPLAVCPALPYEVFLPALKIYYPKDLVFVEIELNF